jgi:hypothetical protein
MPRWHDVGEHRGTGGEEANALVCKTGIRGFESRPVLQSSDYESKGFSKIRRHNRRGDSGE